MAFTQTISASLRDSMNQVSSISFSPEKSLLEALLGWIGFDTSKADELRTLAEKWSNAKCTKSGTTNNKTYSMPTDFLGTIGIDQGFDTVDQKAVCMFRNTSTGQSIRMTIPAPKSSMFEMTLEAGYRVTADKGAELAEDLSAIIGYTVIFESGWLIGKK